MILLFDILAISTVIALPTTKVTTAPMTTVHPTNPHVVLGVSTDPSNETDVDDHVGLRGSIEKELSHLQASYQNMREDLTEWMNTPYHRNVLIPAAIGVMSAVVAVFLYHFVKATFRSCARRFKRCRLSRVSCDLSGDKKRMLPKRDESDDDDVI